MPPEWAVHERTLVAWPCRAELWGTELAAARAETAAVANAVAAFEPVTMACASAADAAQARAALRGDVDVVELPMDDSWVRDSGPVYVLSADGRRRAAIHFGFNAWGGKYPPWDRDAALGARLAALTGDEVVDATGFVLEGGSVLADGAGTLVTTEQCLLHPSRNPDLAKTEIEGELRRRLGAERVVWLGDGLLEDRDTDGHVDLVASFAAPGRLLLLAVPETDPDFAACAENARRAVAAGLEVVAFPPLARVEVAGEPVAVSYLNLYICNGAVVVPQAGLADEDADALARVAGAFPGREIVGVPAATLAYGGGGPHCITQQVPAVAA